MMLVLKHVVSIVVLQLLSHVSNKVDVSLGEKTPYILKYPECSAVGNYYTEV